MVDLKPLCSIQGFPIFVQVYGRYEKVFEREPTHKVVSEEENR